MSQDFEIFYSAIILFPKTAEIFIQFFGGKDRISKSGVKFDFFTLAILFLAYTVVAIQVNFLFSLYSSSETHPSTCRCWQTCGYCFRRFTRRFCFCFILLIWALSYTGTIPLLYTIDSNEKVLKAVYCPGLKRINYFEEWFDRNRFTQTFICNLLPFFISLLLTLLALMKVFGDFLRLLYRNLQTFRCFPCRKLPSASLDSSVTLLPVSPCFNTNHHSAKQKFLRLYIRLILVLSYCLLACIYPIVMYFYLIYFSVLIPLAYAVCNHAVVHLAKLDVNRKHSRSMPAENLLTSSRTAETEICQSIELQSPLVTNVTVHNEESSSTSTIYSTLYPQRLSICGNQRKSFANHLYENTRTLLN